MGRLFFTGRGDGIFFIRMGGAIEKWARMVHKEEKYNQEVECRLQVDFQKDITACESCKK